MPSFSKSSIFSSGLDNSHRSSFGARILSGWGQKVTTRVFSSLSRAFCLRVSSRYLCPRWTPSKLPTVIAVFSEISESCSTLIGHLLSESFRKKGFIISAGWPAHLTTADQVKVEVKNALTRVLSYIEDEPVSAVKLFVGCQSLLLCYLPCNCEHVTDKALVLFSELLNAENMFLRNYQYVNGGNGVYVVEGIGLLVLIDLVGRDLPSDYLAEDAVLFLHKFYFRLNWCRGEYNTI